MSQAPQFLSNLFSISWIACGGACPQNQRECRPHGQHDQGRSGQSAISAKTGGWVAGQVLGGPSFAKRGTGTSSFRLRYRPCALRFRGRTRHRLRDDQQKRNLTNDQDNPRDRRFPFCPQNGADDTDHRGFSVVLAGDGEEGLQKALAHRPDAVLTDQNMPRLDGIGFIRRFRQSQLSTGVPVVFMSTESSPATMQLAREAGATGWIGKPFDESKLLSVVSKLLKA